MSKHLMMTGKKLYMCDTCNKKLSSYHSLWRHKRNGICQNKQRKKFNNQENGYSNIQIVPEIITSVRESAASENQSSSKFDQTSEDEIPTDDEQQYPTNNNKEKIESSESDDDCSDWNWE